MILVNENVTQSYQSINGASGLCSCSKLSITWPKAMALTHKFNSSLKGDEEQKQKQYLLQVIEDDRKQFSASTK